MMKLRQIAGWSLLVLTLSGCEFPVAGIWRTIAYTKITDSQADAGDMRGARESAALALESAWHLKSAETSDWARAAAVAAHVHAGDVAGAQALALRTDENWRGDPELSLYLLILAQLERGDVAGARRSLAYVPGGEATGDWSDLLKLSTLGLVELGDFAEAIEEALQQEKGKAQAEMLATVAIAQARANLVADAMATPEKASAIADLEKTDSSNFIFQIARAIAGRGMELYPFFLRDPALSENFGWHAESYFLTEIALAQARRGEAAAASETANRIRKSEMRVRALSLVAVTLAEAGDPAGARAFADRALALAAESAREATGWALYANERTGADGPAVFAAVSSSDSVAVWSAVALARAERGDIIAMHEALLQARKHLEPERSDDIVEAQSNWAWIMAIGGDIPGALDMAERISDADRRAFALVPAATALAEAGDWISATAVAKDMLGYRDERHVAGRIDGLRTHLSEAHLSENDAKHDEPPPAPWYGRHALNLELLRTLSGVPLAAPSGGGPPIAVEDLLSLAEATRDHGLRARLFAWAAELRAMAGKLEAAKAGIETALAVAQQEPDPYGRALALVEIAYAQAILGAEDAALAALAKAAELAPEIGPEG